MVAIAGLRGTGDWGADERPKNFREMILWMQPNGMTPLTALMAKTKKESVDDPEFAWWEELLTIVRPQTTGALINTDTAVVLISGGLDLKPGDLLLVERAGVAQAAAYTAEIVRVTAVTDDTHITISRGAAGSTAAAIETLSYLTLIGSAYEEGSAKPASTTRNPTKFYNYTQIFKNGYSITNTAKATRARTGDPLKNDKKRKMFDHSTRLELATMFGKRNETTGSGGKPLRTTGGLLYFLAAQSRVVVRTGAYADINAFIDDVKDVFDYTGNGDSSGGDERIVLAGNGALNVLQKLAKASGVVNFSDIIKQYGMTFQRLVLLQGTFYFKNHPLMNIHPLFTNSMFVLDPPGLRYRPLAGRDTKPEDNIQTPGDDAQQGQWLTEMGLEFNHLQTMKFITNIT